MECSYPKPADKIRLTPGYDKTCDIYEKNPLFYRENGDWGLLNGDNQVKGCVSTALVKVNMAGTTPNFIAIGFTNRGVWSVVSPIRASDFIQTLLYIIYVSVFEFNAYSKPFCL